MSESNVKDRDKDRELGNMSVNEDGTRAEASAEQPVRELILQELEKKGNGSGWLWLLFILCLIPNIFNGYHVSSYVFLSQMPGNYYCIVSELNDVGWSTEQIRNVSTRGGINDKNTCTVTNWNYTELSFKGYQNSLEIINEKERPGSIKCRSKKSNFYRYEQEDGLSIVPEWDLICENSAWRTTVQVALSIGKFIGATSFGVLSDKYGRKNAFVVASLIFMSSGMLVTFSPWYFTLLLGRIGLGVGGSGIFYPAFTLLTENAGQKHRSWMSIAFNFSYPIGMLILAITAYNVNPWRDLSLVLAIPPFLMLIHIYLMVESPRWLISKGRDSRAYKMVFRKKIPVELSKRLLVEKPSPEPAEKAPEKKIGIGTRIKNGASEVTALYATSKLRTRAFICHFTWCVTSLCYYITALNADNLSANRYIYVASTGAVDFGAYIITIIILRYVGRRLASCALFFYASACLLILLVVPDNIVVTLALMGRLGITAVYSIVTLHTAELFPTEIRNSALGISSTCAHIGSIAAPYIVDFLGDMAWWIPTTICGVCTFVAALLSLLQPETSNRGLKDHVKQESNDNNEITNK